MTSIETSSGTSGQVCFQGNFGGLVMGTLLSTRRNRRTRRYEGVLDSEHDSEGTERLTRGGCRRGRSNAHYG
jgi:hypothetical protein